MEWKKQNWIFHDEDFWISKLMSDYSRTFYTLIGSTNYGHRSYYHDLESEFLIETHSEKLEPDLQSEKNRLFLNGIEMRKLGYQNKIPIMVHWIVPAAKFFF